MRKSFKRNPLMLFLAVMSMSLLVSCSGGSGPEGVAKNFLQHVSKGEFEEAKKYADEPTGSLLTMAESLAGEQKEQLKDKKVNIEIISSEVNEAGDKATVKYKETEEGQDAATAEEKEITLAKVDDEWKVSIDKESMNKEGNAPAGAEGEGNMEMESDMEMTEGDSIQ
jgi:hypothetical protein